MSTSVADPTQVKCRGKGLSFGYVGRFTETSLDTRRAGPGITTLLQSYSVQINSFNPRIRSNTIQTFRELTVFCTGPAPDRPAYCELIDHTDGKFTLKVQAQDVGTHLLNIKYDNIHVPGSPFPVRISGASLLKIVGPGIQDGVLGRFLPHFQVDTSAAGRGEIKMEIGGPKGAFNVETRRVDKVLHCSYHVREPGQYIINILWCDDHVPDSPYHVFIWRTEEELRRFVMVRQQLINQSKLRARNPSGNQ